jgi:hypothetical protein
MAQLPPNPNFTGAQKDAYAKQYGGYWNGSTYNPTGTAPVAAATPKPAPIAAGAPATPAPNMGQTSSSSTYTSGSPLVAPTATSAAPGGGTIQNSFRNALVSQLQTNPNKVAITDPDLAPQARAFEDAQTRTLAKQQQDLAEQAFAGGALRTGAYGADLAGLRQQQGEAIAQHNAGLIGDAQQRRTQALMQSLGIGGNFLTAQSAQGIQSSLGQGQLKLGLLQALLGDRQANNQLGLNAALGGANLNQSAILHMLGI